MDKTLHHKNYLLLLSLAFMSSGCSKDIWKEPVEKDPITDDWIKYCHSLMKKLDGSCAE